MALFGENLRRERELRGITLAELSAATKIPLRYLTALENDEFDRLPGGIFNRGYVRSVAHYLGLDEREWVGAFVHAAKEEPEVLARYAPPEHPARSGRPGWTTSILIVVLFAAAVFAVHSVRARRAAEATSGFPPTSQTSSLTPGTPAATVLPTRVSEGNLANSPVLPDVSELHLQVFSIQSTWVKITADGELLYEGEMKPRETRVFRATQELNVSARNASAVVLTLNGETLAPLGSPDEAKSITLTRKDLPPPRP